MTASPNREPTLFDVIERLDKLTNDVEKVSSNVENLSTDVENLSTDIENLSTDVENLSTEVKRFDERFTDYRQATQWVVQLAFTLIASATITVIITAVFRK
jgi:outer membrane murein-binding lipoprotein Lpp